VWCERRPSIQASGEQSGMKLVGCLALPSSALFALTALPPIAPSLPVVSSSDRLADLGRFLMERNLVALPPGISRNRRSYFRRELLAASAVVKVPK
jgi:hypothetical protein